MNKEAFMRELKERLTVLSEEERNEALAFYEDYFADAGTELEAQVIAELGSPERVARMILNDLKGTLAEAEYTEQGYHKEDFEEKFEVAKPYEVAAEQDTTAEQDTMWSKSTSKQENKEQEYRYAGKEAASEKKAGSSNTALLILLLVFTFPIWSGLAIAFLSVWFAFLCLAIGLAAGFGIAAGACLIGGVAVFGYGVFRLLVVPLYGAALLGGGLLVTGIGLLLLLLAVLSGQLVKGLCKAVGAIWKSLFGKRKMVTA